MKNLVLALMIGAFSSSYAHTFDVEQGLGREFKIGAVNIKSVLYTTRLPVLIVEESVPSNLYQMSDDDMDKVIGEALPIIAPITTAVVRCSTNVACVDGVRTAARTFGSWVGINVAQGVYDSQKP